MRLGFVVPRYGRDIAGGAETLVGQLAWELARRGDDVQILTTCARDNRSWENYFQPGIEVMEEHGVRLPVSRFAVDRRNLERWIPLQIRISQGLKLRVEETLEWMEHSVNSSSLYQHIATHSASFDHLFFAPYLFGTTFWGSLIAPTRSVLIPCLHDESYAYLDIVRAMFRQVQGAMFNALPEQKLAFELYGVVPGGEVGMGFRALDSQYVKALAPYFEKPFPYVVCLGRKETGKNVHLLIDSFIALKESGQLPQLKLVIVGGGSFDDLHRPDAKLRSDIIDLAQVSEIEKHRILKHSVALCQPSTNESFSIVLMEAWQLGVPALVNANCRVTRHHVICSGGGLHYSNQSEFNATLAEFVKKPIMARTLGAAGSAYVAKRYSWQAVLERFDQVLHDIRRGSECSQQLSV